MANNLPPCTFPECRYSAPHARSFHGFEHPLITKGRLSGILPSEALAYTDEAATAAASTTKVPAVNIAGLTFEAVDMYDLNARALTDEKLATDLRALTLANRAELVSILRDALIDALIAAGRRTVGGPIIGQPPHVHALIEAVANFVQDDLHDSAEVIRDMMARAIRFDQTATKLADFAAAAEPRRAWCDDAKAVVSDADACGRCSACIGHCEHCEGPLSPHAAGGLVCTNHACFLGNGQATVRQ